MAPARMFWVACALNLSAPLANAEQIPTEISIPGERVVPESLTSDKAGNVYIGSVVARTIFRATPGAAIAEPWIKPETNGMQNIYGVFADDASSTLWVCSNSSPAAPDAPPPPPSTLMSFDLKSGEPKGKYPLPGPGAFCNDVAIDAKGTVFAVDTANMQIVRLPSGASTLEQWSVNDVFGPKGGVLDGIAILGDTLYVNTLATSKLFSVAIGSDGKAGAAKEVQLDRPLERPDGMRSFGTDKLLVVEGGPGRLSKITLSGGDGKVETLKEGFADNAVAVTVVGETGYVIEAQFRTRRDPAYTPKPFKATAVPVGKP